MIKSATAVKAKIKNKAGGNSDKSQIMLRIYLMERLLERVSLSKYRDNFVLKGGLLVSSLVGVDVRSTMDVDTTVKLLPLNKESAQRILEEIMAIDIEDGVAFRITKVQDGLLEEEYYGGIIEDEDYAPVLNVALSEIVILKNYIENPYISTQHGVKGESHDTVLFIAENNSRTPVVSMSKFFDLWSSVNVVLN